MRRYHWSRSRFSTSAPQRQQWRSAPSTCSRARVPSLGHQSTGDFCAIGQARLQEAQEDPLVPAVEGRVGRDHLGLPVERSRPSSGAAGACSRCCDIVHVNGWPPLLIAAFSAGRPNASKPIGEEHVVAQHPPIAGERVGRGLDVPVADVEIARRVVVHRQQVVLGPAGVGEVGLVQAQVGPALLPARLDGRRVVALDRGSGPSRPARCPG